MEFLRNIIEAVLFANKETMTIDAIRSVFPEGQAPDGAQIRALLVEIAADYSGRGLELVEVSSGFRFQVKSEYSAWVSRLWEERTIKYSRALLETLALIAYRQPITRGEIEAIRGVVVSSQIIKTLTDRNWVRVVGHREVPGRPALFATTKDFLDYFNLRKLEDLPTLQDVREWQHETRLFDLSVQAPLSEDLSSEDSSHEEASQEERLAPEPV